MVLTCDEHLIYCIFIPPIFGRWVSLDLAFFVLAGGVREGGGDSGLAKSEGGTPHPYPIQARYRPDTGLAYTCPYKLAAARLMDDLHAMRMEAAIVSGGKCYTCNS